MGLIGDLVGFFASSAVAGTSHVISERELKRRADAAADEIRRARLAREAQEKLQKEEDAARIKKIKDDAKEKERKTLDEYENILSQLDDVKRRDVHYAKKYLEEYDSKWIRKDYSSRLANCPDCGNLGQCTDPFCSKCGRDMRSDRLKNPQFHWRLPISRAIKGKEFRASNGDWIYGFVCPNCGRSAGDSDYCSKCGEVLRIHVDGPNAESFRENQVRQLKTAKTRIEEARRELKCIKDAEKALCDSKETNASIETVNTLTTALSMLEKISDALENTIEEEV